MKLNALFLTAKVKFLLLIIDACSIFLVATFFAQNSFEHSAIGVDLVILLKVILILTFSYIFGSYDIHQQRFLTVVLIQLAVIFSTLSLVAVILYLFEMLGFLINGKDKFLWISMSFLVWSLALRLMYRFVFKKMSQNREIFFLTEKESQEYIIKDLTENKFGGRSHFIFSRDSSLDKQIENLTSEVLVVGSDIHGLSLGTQKLILEKRLNGLKIIELSDFYETNFGKVPLFYLQNRWFVLASGFNALASKLSFRMKRIVDLLISCLMLILTAPIFAACVILIRLDSTGPAIYKQTRVGLKGQLFVIYKFRSMKVDAEVDGPKWADFRDSRITKVGGFLRKSRLDELPQLFNIIKGEMSFVGPRPERPEFVVDLEREIPFFGCRHSVLPGLTGWAQVSYRYGASVEDARQKLQYDLFYIKNQSLLLDVRIIMKTVKIVLGLKGN